MADVPDYEREGAQPPPIRMPDVSSSHDLAVLDLILYCDPGVGVTLAKDGLLARRDYGQQKYGTVLHADNGRDHLADVLDETEDKIAYLRVAFEHDPELYKIFWGDYIAELKFLVRLREFLSTRDVQNFTPPATITEQET